MKCSEAWILAVGLGAMNLAGVGLVAVNFMGGCAASKQETRVEPQAAPVQQSVGVPPETYDQLQLFFQRRASPLQYRCYTSVLERTGGKMIDGDLGLSMVILPGGKANEVKITRSTLNSPDIEKCVLDELRSWVWPDVPAPAPYAPSILFKSAF